MQDKQARNDIGVVKDELQRLEKMIREHKHVPEHPDKKGNSAMMAALKKMSEMDREPASDDLRESMRVFQCNECGRQFQLITLETQVCSHCQKDHKKPLIIKSPMTGQDIDLWKLMSIGAECLPKMSGRDLDPPAHDDLAELITEYMKHIRCLTEHGYDYNGLAGAIREENWVVSKKSCPKIDEAMGIKIARLERELAVANRRIVNKDKVIAGCANAIGVEITEDNA